MSASTNDADRLVVLRDGAVIPTPVYLLLLDLERRGIAARRDGDGLLVGPRDRLTEADRAALRRWKSHLLQYLNYTADDSHLFADTYGPSAPAAQRIA